MAITINEELTALLGKADTVKLLVTTDETGAPHVVVKDSLRLDEEKRLFYLELLESSHTNRNRYAASGLTVRSQWQW